MRSYLFFLGVSVSLISLVLAGETDPTEKSKAQVLVEQIALGSSLPATVAGKYLGIGPQNGSTLYYVTQTMVNGQVPSITVSSVQTPTKTLMGATETFTLQGPQSSAFCCLGVSGAAFYTGWKNSSTITVKVDPLPYPWGSGSSFSFDITTSDPLISLNCDNRGKLYVVTENAIWAYDTNTPNNPIWTISRYSFLPKITASVVGGDNLYLACKSDGTYEGYNAPGYIVCLPDLPSYTGLISSNPLTAIAGATSSGFADGKGADSKFTNIQGLAFYGRYLYVADTGNNAIRRVDVTSSNHPVTTIAGGVQPPIGLSISPMTSGTGNQAYFDNPMNCVIDSGGQTVYFMAGGGTYSGYQHIPVTTSLTLQRVWLPAYDSNMPGTNDSSLRDAVQNKNVQTVTSLLSEGANPAAFFDGQQGWTALHVLASQYQDAYKNKISNPALWVTWTDMWSAMIARITTGHAPTPQQVLTFFLHPNQWGDTVLHTAASYGAWEMISWEMISWVIDLCKMSNLSQILSQIPGAGGNTMLHTIMANNKFDKSSDGSWTLGFVKAYYWKFYGPVPIISTGGNGGFADMFSVPNNAGWRPLSVGMYDRGSKHAKLYYDVLGLEPQYTYYRRGGDRETLFSNAISAIPFSADPNSPRNKLPFQFYDDKDSQGSKATNASLIGYLSYHPT